MKVINDGEQIKITATFWEAAILTDMAQMAERAYERAGVPEFAEYARQVLEELKNAELVIK